MPRKNQIILGLIIFFVIISIIGYLTLNKQKKLPVSDNISDSVKEICKTKSKLECHGDCLDGFGADCYFDSTEYDKESLQSGFSFPEETKKACFAIHSNRVCGDCFNKFELRKNGVLEEVSCEEFFQAIENRNNECNN